MDTVKKVSELVSFVVRSAWLSDCCQMILTFGTIDHFYLNELVRSKRALVRLCEFVGNNGKGLKGWY